MINNDVLFGDKPRVLWKKSKNESKKRLLKVIKGHFGSFQRGWKQLFFDILKYFLMFRIFHVRMYDGNKAYHPSDRRIINREVAIKIRFDLNRPPCFDFDQLTWFFRNHFFQSLHSFHFYFEKVTSCWPPTWFVTWPEYDLKNFKFDLGLVNDLGIVYPYLWISKDGTLMGWQ